MEKEIRGCVALINGNQCGADGINPSLPNLSFDLPLCNQHRAELYNRSDMAYRVERVTSGGEDGSVYVIRSSSGHIKIGHTKDLYKRLQGLTTDKRINDGSPVEILAVLSGGHETEAQLHHKFQHLRVWDSFGEQFLATPEIIEWASAQGLTAEGVRAVNDYKGYVERREARLKRTEKKSMGLDELMSKLTIPSAEEFWATA